MGYLHKGLIESLRTKKRKRQKIYKEAFRASGRPIALNEISSLHVNGVLEIETFYENVGRIFPLILELVLEGYSISRIERTLGFKDRSLENSLQVYTRLNDKINEVRKLRSDSRLLTDA